MFPVTFTAPQFTQGLSLWEMRWLAAVRAFTVVLLAAIGVLLVVQFIYHGIISSRAQKKDTMKLAILKAITRANAAPTQEERGKVRIAGGAQLFERRGLSVITQVYDSLSDANKKTLREILINMGCAKYMAKQLDTDNEDYLAEVVRTISMLDLVGLDQRIATLMYTHSHNIDLQYEAFLALSLLGSKDAIVKVCMDKDFVQTLSFRSLQQVLKAYTGDKLALYTELLSSPDAYVVRICIRRAGTDGLTGLADRIMPWLDSDNYNITIDAVRAMGMLKYAPAAQKVAALVKHERWEVRSVATTALAAINAQGYEKELINALQDREWQVRYNAAAALRTSPRLAIIRRAVAECGDRYANEMLEFMTQTAEIWRQAE